MCGGPSGNTVDIVDVDAVTRSKSGMISLVIGCRLWVFFRLLTWTHYKWRYSTVCKLSRSSNHRETISKIQAAAAAAV